MLNSMHHPEVTTMRTTINLDDDLLAKAAKLGGELDRSALISASLKAFIEREIQIRQSALLPR